MAELNTRPKRIPASVQLWAVAWLRWRMFVNTFRRGPTGSRRVAGLIGGIVLRLIVWPILAAWVVGPVVACGFFAWAAVAQGHRGWMLPLMTGVALLWQFVAVNGTNISANAPTFEPASLLRFPVPFGRYFVLRTVIGLMTPSTVVGCLALLAAALGITIAQPALGPAAFVTLAIYALTNIYLARMLGIWMERWLATRRAREVFGVLMAVLVIGVQFLNFDRSMRHVARHQSWILSAAMRSASVMHWLPPGFAARAVLGQGMSAGLIADELLLAAWTALFAAGFAYRLHKQYLGEYLVEGPVRTVVTKSADVGLARGKADSSAALRNDNAVAVPIAVGESRVLSPALEACLRKELLYLKGNSNMLVSMVTPLIFVAIFCRGSLAEHPAYLLQGAIGYALLGPLAALYNVFGADGCGVQLYLISPARLRDVVLAKNLVSLALLGVQVVLAWTLADWLSAQRIPLVTQAAAGFWVVFVIGVNLAVGTLRSIQSPRKFALGQTRGMRGAPTSRTSNLLVLAILFGSLLLQAPVVWLTRHFHSPALAVLIFAPLAAVGVGAYALVLRNSERVLLENRDELTRELCGA